MQVVILLFWFVCSRAAGDCQESNFVSNSHQRPGNYGKCNSTWRNYCEDVFSVCQAENSWTSCYEQRIANCRQKGRMGGGSILRNFADPSKDWEESPTPEHDVHVPSSALRRSGAPESGAEVLMVVTVLNSTHFKHPSRKHGRRLVPGPPKPTGTVLGGTVLMVQAVGRPLQNLTEPITLTFKYNKRVASGVCVFWEELNPRDGTGNWSKFGCNTRNTGREFVCRCNHLSFFAVLVNPDLVLSEEDAINLSLITYVGSALSVVFTIISLIVYSCLNKRQPERGIGLHMHLTAALLCLHLCFLLSCAWAWRLSEGPTDWVCRALGLLLHWSLLATVCWSALEGFHLYLLLVRVFNIYIRRYLLKLSVVGWGVPTLIALVCGVSGVYGKYTLEFRDYGNRNTTMQLCWISSKFRHKRAVTYVTTVAFPFLAVLCNACMLGLVIVKLWRLRGGGAKGGGAKGSWEKASRLGKDCVTVLGLSCVLGLPFGLLTVTYVDLVGVYVFTTLTSLQGVFVFLWSLALTCKSRSDTASTSKDTSTQRIMTTSFNS
ncbi:adhesion G protein-coupled receptor G3-like [Syngnathoides biaculeatus]|uniref:adhesion G protein-coupled receptor G3-like n=1 Tax=Syngnathoides biaculeatus TaxID=300417 RepID=UPI002ADDD214|nr:adhesion G protein-coupled receptor G3-like [Syngnathoides biaculeatus]